MGSPAVGETKVIIILTCALNLSDIYFTSWTSGEGSIHRFMWNAIWLPVSTSDLQLQHTGRHRGHWPFTVIERYPRVRSAEREARPNNNRWRRSVNSGPPEASDFGSILKEAKARTPLFVRSPRGFNSLRGGCPLLFWPLLMVLLMVAGWWRRWWWRTTRVGGKTARLRSVSGRGNCWFGGAWTKDKYVKVFRGSLFTYDSADVKIEKKKRNINNNIIKSTGMKM